MNERLPDVKEKKCTATLELFRRSNFYDELRELCMSDNITAFNFPNTTMGMKLFGRSLTLEDFNNLIDAAKHKEYILKSPLQSLFFSCLANGHDLVPVNFSFHELNDLYFVACKMFFKYSNRTPKELRESIYVIVSSAERAVNLEKYFDSVYMNSYYVHHEEGRASRNLGLNAPIVVATVQFLRESHKRKLRDLDNMSLLIIDSLDSMTSQSDDLDYVFDRISKKTSRIVFINKFTKGAQQFTRDRIRGPVFIGKNTSLPFKFPLFTFTAGHVENRSSESPKKDNPPSEELAEHLELNDKEEPHNVNVKETQPVNKQSSQTLENLNLEESSLFEVEKQEKQKEDNVQKPSTNTKNVHQTDIVPLRPNETTPPRDSNDSRSKSKDRSKQEIREKQEETSKKSTKTPKARKSKKKISPNAEDLRKLSVYDNAFKLMHSTPDKKIAEYSLFKEMRQEHNPSPNKYIKAVDSDVSKLFKDVSRTYDKEDDDHSLDSSACRSPLFDDSLSDDSTIEAGDNNFKSRSCSQTSVNVAKRDTSDISQINESMTTLDECDGNDDENFDEAILETEIEYLEDGEMLKEIDVAESDDSIVLPRKRSSEQEVNSDDMDSLQPPQRKRLRLGNNFTPMLCTPLRNPGPWLSEQEILRMMRTPPPSTPPPLFSQPPPSPIGLLSPVLPPSPQHNFPFMPYVPSMPPFMGRQQLGVQNVVEKKCFNFSYQSYPQPVINQELNNMLEDKELVEMITKYKKRKIRDSFFMLPDLKAAIERVRITVRENDRLTRNTVIIAPNSECFHAVRISLIKWEIPTYLTQSSEPEDLEESQMALLKKEVGVVVAHSTKILEGIRGDVCILHFDYPECVDDYLNLVGVGSNPINYYGDVVNLLYDHSMKPYDFDVILTQNDMSLIH